MLLTSNHALLEQADFDRLALAWQRRALTLNTPGRSWAHLQQSDAQLLAGLHLLVQIQKQSPTLGPERLQEALMPGELFVLALLAMHLQHAPTWHACTAMAQALPGHQGALLASAHWCDAQAIQWALGHWPTTQSGTPPLCSVFELHAAQRHPQVLHAMRQRQPWRELSSDVDQAVPILQAVLQLGLHVPLPELRQLARKVMLRAAGHQDAFLNLLCPSAELLMLQHQKVPSDKAYTQARQALRDVATQSRQPHWAWQASQVLACANPKEFQEILISQAKDAALKAVYLQGLGWSGRRDAVGPLMAALHEPVWAKVAGASIMLITGSVPVRDGWEGRAPAKAVADDAGDAIRPADPLLAHPQPDAQGFVRWWQTHGARITDGEVWLNGRTLTPAALAQTLHTGPLHARTVAARKLQWLHSEPRRLDTHGPSPVQRQWMQTHLPPIQQPSPKA